MIAFLLGTLAAAVAAAADGSAAGGGAGATGPLDQQIILVGRDEAELPLPAPWEPAAFAFPSPDMQRPDTPLPTPIGPPAGDWADMLPQAGYTYVGCTGAPPGHPIRGKCARGAGGMETHSV